MLTIDKFVDKYIIGQLDMDKYSWLRDNVLCFIRTKHPVESMRARGYDSDDNVIPPVPWCELEGITYELRFRQDEE